MEASPLSPRVRLGWIPGGDHSFKPSRRSGLSEAQNWATAVNLCDGFLRQRLLRAADQGPRAIRRADFYFVPADTPEQAVGLILRLVAERIPARFGLDPTQQVQVLCPMARGGCGARALNAELQRLLNPDPPEQVERFGWRFAPGDKVMQIANDYEKEVFNSDLGTFDAIDLDNNELTVLFEGRPVAYGWGELDTLVPAYACTIHKSQGSEVPAVVIPLLTQHYPMLQRNLVYTGITRARRLVVLVGQEKALAMAVRNPHGRRRFTKLAERLNPAE